MALFLLKWYHFLLQEKCFQFFKKVNSFFTLICNINWCGCHFQPFDLLSGKPSQSLSDVAIVRVKVGLGGCIL